jgi:GST-like protein
MNQEYVVYGAAFSGSVPVEAALTLLGEPFRVVERVVWEDKAAAEEMAKVNPLKQVPALVLPSGELMTESAAILTWLADTHPGSGLSPAPESPLRPRFLRWMSYLSAQIYALYWVRDDPSRLAADKAHEAVIKARTVARIAYCWEMMEAQVAPAGRFILGDEISVLDLYMAVTSRWGPRRKGFYAVAPKLGEVVRRVDTDPRLADFWPARMAFIENWEG